MNSKATMKMPSCLLATVLLLAPLAFLVGPATGATTINNLGTGNPDEILTFNTPGEDTSLFLKVPKGATVTTASISLEGMFIKSTTPSKVEFDYNNTDTNGGWRSTTSDNVSTTQKTPQGFEAGKMAAGDLSLLANDDGQYVSDEMKMISYAYHQFSYGVAMTDITEIQVEWNGWAMYMDSGTYENLYGAHMFIWNNVTQTWELLAFYDNFKDTSDNWLKKTITGANLDNYLYNGVELRVIVQNIYSDKGSMYAAIYSDFAKVVVTGKSIQYPSDVRLDVNDDSVNELTHAGILTGTITFSGPEFKVLLQGLLNAAGPGAGDITIPLSVSTTTIGKIRVGNVSIVFDPYVNQAPQVTDIPNTFHFPEDTDAVNLINLTHYFSDDIDTSWAMTYELVNESDPDLLHGTVSTHGMMSFTTPTENWFGSATFKVKATDTSALSVTSAVFSVTVDPKPDAPVLKPIAQLNFTENKGATVAISATDPDTLYGGTDTLTYGAVFISGKTLFNLNDKTGTAAFLPKDADVGTYTVNFTATDALGNFDSKEMTFKVNDVNNAPNLDAIGKQTLNEDAPFSLQLGATDPDASDADMLTYSADFQNDMVLFSVSTDGAISFTPNQSMVGTHKVKLIVKDSGGLTDFEEVLFDIKNVNDAPVLKAIPDQTINRNTPFHLQAIASDEDIGYAESELLAFSDNSNLFDIDENTGWMNFTPTKANVGKTTVTITVTDLAGATATTSFKLEIVLNNTAPMAQILVSDNKTKVKEGGKFVLTATATDDDDDPLTYKWSEKGKELGADNELTLKGLKAGKHIISLEVSDGITKTTVEQTLTVEKEDTGLPGFDAGVAFMALFVVGIVSALISRRRQ